MKKRINITATALIGIIIGFTVGVPTNGRAQPLPTNGLAAYYPFGGNASDASGHGHDGIVHGATLGPDRFGLPNQAYVFNGTGAWIEVPNNTSIDITDDLTVAVWVNHKELDNDLLYVHRVNAYGMHYSPQEAPEQRLSFLISPNNGGSWTTIGFPHTPNINQWYHYAITYSSGNGVCRCYVDGVLIGTKTNAVQISSSGRELAIGGYSTVKFLNGTMNEIRVYDRVLNASEILALYHFPSLPKVGLLTGSNGVIPTFDYLAIGTNYQLQASGNLNSWTNYGLPFNATNRSMVYPESWSTDASRQLFFRLRVEP